MTPQDIDQRLATVAGGVLQLRIEPGAQVRREETPSWDSLTHIRLILAVEEEFSVRFTAEEVGPIDSIHALATLLRRKL